MLVLGLRGLRILLYDSIARLCTSPGHEKRRFVSRLVGVGVLCKPETNSKTSTHQLSEKKKKKKKTEPNKLVKSKIWRSIG